MRTVGIIAEYNPFHNGHQYHIFKAKEQTHADYCIVVLSGNFVQRGEPSVFEKAPKILPAELWPSCPPWAQSTISVSAANGKTRGG